MVEATKMNQKPPNVVKAVEPEHEVDGLIDVCSNPDCGMGYDKEKKKIVRLNPAFQRTAVRPSDMLCSQCEGRLVEKPKK